MDSPKDRFESCYITFFDKIDYLRAYLAIAQMIYLVLIAITVYQYRQHFTGGLNKYLCIGWTVECIVDFVRSVVSIMIDREDTTHETLALRWLIFGNIILLHVVIFRLKTLQIYLEDMNEDENEIKDRLDKL